MELPISSHLHHNSLQPAAPRNMHSIQQLLHACNYLSSKMLERGDCPQGLGMAGIFTIYIGCNNLYIYNIHTWHRSNKVNCHCLIAYIYISINISIYIYIVSTSADQLICKLPGTPYSCTFPQADY